MRVLLDTNIMLDSFLEREPFVRDAKALLEAIQSQRIEGYVTATTLTDIFYIVRRQTRSLELAKRAVSTTLTLMQVCTVDRSILSAAISSSLPDFEDGVQLACAISENLNAIITRDPKGFVGATVAILSASEFLFRLSSDS